MVNMEALLATSIIILFVNTDNVDDLHHVIAESLTQSIDVGMPKKTKHGPMTNIIVDQVMKHNGSNRTPSMPKITDKDHPWPD
jgi:hypothetical protein